MHSPSGYQSIVNDKAVQQQLNVVGDVTFLGRDEPRHAFPGSFATIAAMATAGAIALACVAWLTAGIARTRTQLIDSGGVTIEGPGQEAIRIVWDSPTLGLKIPVVVSPDMECGLVGKHLMGEFYWSRLLPGASQKWLDGTKTYVCHTGDEQCCLSRTLRQGGIRDGTHVKLVTTMRGWMPSIATFAPLFYPTPDWRYDSTEPLRSELEASDETVSNGF